MRRFSSRAWVESSRRIVATTEAELQRRRHRALAVAGGVATLALVVGGASAVSVQRTRTNDHERLVGRELDDIELRLQGVVDRSTAALATAPAIVEGGTIDLQAFDAFAAGISRRPVVAVALAVVVTDDEREQFEREHTPIVAPDDSPGATSQAAPRRADYYPVVAVRPTESPAATLLGLDIETDPLRRAAVSTARDAGTAAITPVGVLPYSPEPAIVVVQPLYRDGGHPTTVDARRAELIGLVSVSFSAQDLLDDASAGTHVVRAVAIGTGTSSAHGVITRDFEFAGTAWTLRAEATGPPSPAPSLAIAGGALAIAGLLAELVRRSWVYERDLARSSTAIAHHQHRTERLQQLSAELAVASTSSAASAAIVAAAADLLHPAEVELDIVDESGVPVPVAHDDSDDDHPTDDGRRRQVVALRGDDTALGTLTLTTDPDTPVDAAMLRTLIDLSCQALLRARRYDGEHRLVSALQTMLLPVVPRRIGTITLAATYRPVLRSSGVGGDWYDAFEIPGGVAAVVGDVVGKGVRAAGAMGQLRIGSRTVGSRGSSAEFLESLDELAEPPNAGFMATAAHVSVDTERALVTSALAGHLPPLLLSADGTTEWLGGEPGPPLGLRTSGTAPAREEVSTELHCPCRIILYTDGLVERRGEPIDVGLERLAAAARQAAALDLDAFLAYVLEVTAPPDGATDDVAALCLDME